MLEVLKVCRYAFKTYKSHFACFACRKVFKKTPIEDYLKQRGDDFAYWQLVKSIRWKNKKRKEVEERFNTTLEKIKTEYFEEISICPDCGGRMANMGLDFRAPKKTDIQAWQAVKGLFVTGRSFLTCGCDGPGFIPANRSEYKACLKEMLSQYKETLQSWKKYNKEYKVENRIEAVEYWNNRIEMIENELAKII